MALPRQTFGLSDYDCSYVLDSSWFKSKGKLEDSEQEWSDLELRLPTQPSQLHEFGEVISCLNKLLTGRLPRASQITGLAVGRDPENHLVQPTAQKWAKVTT